MLDVQDYSILHNDDVRMHIYDRVGSHVENTCMTTSFHKEWRFRIIKLA
jgi:hypothetical protein